MKKRLKFLLICFAVLPVVSAENFKPGEYIVDGGWGHLTVKVEKGKTLFDLTSLGGNFHTCGLSGEIKNSQARLEALEKECVVTFTKKGRDIEVTQSGEECRYYCGARATFEGLYLEPLQGCDGPSRTKTRKQFKQLYDKKEYEPALKTLSELFKTCAKTFDWIETGWIKNDIAITQYKLGDSKACKATLASFEVEAKQTDDEVRGNHAPSDADAWLPVVKAARYNLKLCSAKPAKK